jgi:signal transduction histidine kinase
MSTSKDEEVNFRWPADSIPGPAAYVNKSLHYQFMNKKYKGMFKIGPEVDISKLHVKDVLGEKYNDAKDKVNKAIKGESILYEADLGFAIIQAHYIPDFKIPNDPNSEVVGFFMMGIDVTELRKTQVNYKQELEEEVKRKTADLEKTQSLLIEHEKMAALGTLVLGVAHEVNTPLGISLTGITHLNEMSNDINAKFKTDDLNEDDFKKFLSTSEEITGLILNNIGKISNLINKFKQLSITKNINDSTVFNLHTYTNTLILNINREYNNKNIKINNHIKTNIDIFIVQDAYRKVIDNLIINSLDHAFSTGMIGVIDIDCIEDKEQYILNYSDNGKGIKEEDINSIFNPFFTTKRSFNPGLGLNIIYNIISTQLNGTITCTSKEDKGTNFKIIIKKEN